MMNNNNQISFQGLSNNQNMYNNYGQNNYGNRLNNVQNNMNYSFSFNPKSQILAKPNFNFNQNNNQYMPNQNMNNQNISKSNINYQNINNFNQNLNTNNNNYNNNNNSNFNPNFAQQIQNNNGIKCELCLQKQKNVKKCPICNSAYCENCLNDWIKAHKTCFKCKNKINLNAFISLQNNDDNSNNIIKNSQQNNIIEKDSNNKQLNSKNKYQKYNFSNFQNNNIINENENENEEDENQKYCPTHKSKIDYFCVQCEKYYCSNCLLFYNSEVVKQHQGHIILQLSKMNDSRIQEVLNEYKKLSVTKNSLDNLVGLSNLKIRENEIKKCEIINFMNLITEEYLKKIDEDSKELNSIMNDLKKKKESIENSINSIPNGFNNIVNSNDYVQGNVVSKELQKINQIDNNLKNQIKEKADKNPLLHIENYESDYIDFTIPNGRQYIEGKDIVNQDLNLIPGFPSRITITYLENKVFISFCIDINMPLNSPQYPKFYTYITIKNKKYGLEFINLSEQSFPQNFANQGGHNNNIGISKFQINRIGMEAEPFLYLIGEDNKLTIKIFVIKIFYKY